MKIGLRKQKPKQLPDPRMALVRYSVGSSPTARELAVMEYVALGLTNRQIGERLYLSEETIKTYIRFCLMKLGARNRTHAVWRAIEAGWLTAPSRGEMNAPSRPFRAP